MSASRNLFFTNAVDHAVHIQRLYRYLIDEMRIFERFWGMAENYYEGNLFLQDMHIALIYLNDEMKFRNSPEDPPFKDRAPLHPTIEDPVRRYNEPQYKSSFPATVPYESPVYVPKTDENMYRYQANPEYAVAGPSHASIRSEVNHSVGEGLLNDKGRVAPIDETSIHPGAVSAGRYHSHKGKEREAQSDGAPYQNGMAVKTEPTEPLTLGYNNYNYNYNTVSNVGLRFPPRKQIPPRLDLAKSNIDRCASRSHQMTTPTVREAGYSLPYRESHAYWHRGNRTFNPPRSVSPDQYETRPPYWKRKLSEEVEDRYTKSRKRCRRD